MILDIRKDSAEKVTGITFDDTGDFICLSKEGDCITMSEPSINEQKNLCLISDLDNFIKALQKAKELWV